MASLNVDPVPRESTAGIIARQLREAIAGGTLAPGTQLGEADLAHRFEVSRGPLREAMQRLVQEGLLRSEPHRGLFVVDLEPGDVFDLYIARTAVERAAAVRIMRHDPPPVDDLWTVHADMAAAARRDDAAAVSDADLRFHEQLVVLSGSRRLLRMMGTLMVETRMCLTALQRTYADTHERVTEHGRIIEAIAARDESRATQLLEAHMADAVRRLAPGVSLFDEDDTDPDDGTD